ncbi:MAG: hypothetical protein MJZ81_07465 [Bacteroidales bacterium]|nr:hypothetical protein [Bacteroidales bacterium]
MPFFRHRFGLKRVKICRHCGQPFETETPAQRTCKRPECVRWAKELKHEQNRKSQQRWLAKKRQQKGNNK